MSSEKSLTPQIRFKGFTEAWEQRKLSQIVSINGGKDYKYLEAGPIPVYGTGGYMTSVSQALSYNQDAIGIGRKGTIDCPYILKAPFWTIDTLFYSIPINNADLQFTLCLFLNVNWKSKDESTGLPSLSKQTIEKTLVKTPNALEQQKIGLTFSRLNSLITLHQRKLDALKKIKSALLEKMFPKDGSNIPEIRFTGFTEAWEQRKFSDVVKTRRGLTYKPTDISNNGVRVLRSSNISEDVFVQRDDDVFVKQEAINIKCVNENDILITSANGSSRLVGKHAIVSSIKTNQAVHGGFMLLASTKEPYFINASMSSTWYKKFIELFVSGGNGSIGNLSKNDLDNYEIFIPVANEQKRLGLLFRNVDSLITLHQRKLDALKKIKSALLEKMFV